MRKSSRKQSKRHNSSRKQNRSRGGNFNTRSLAGQVGEEGMANFQKLRLGMRKRGQAQNPITRQSLYTAVQGRNRVNATLLGENGNNEYYEGSNSFENFHKAHGKNTRAAYTQGTRSSKSLKREKPYGQIQPALRENVLARESQRRENGTVAKSWQNNYTKARPAINLTGRTRSGARFRPISSR